jgi:hypothetical protein
MARRSVAETQTILGHLSVQLTPQNGPRGVGSGSIRRAANDGNEELDELMRPCARRLPVLLDGGEVERGSDDDSLVIRMVP